MKNKKIIFVVATIALVLCLALALIACDKKGGNDNNGGDNGGGQITPGVEMTYTVTVTRSGGDVFANIPVVVYDEQHVLTAYTSTDKNGVASFAATEGTYTLEFGLLPEGYNGKAGYTITKDEPDKTFALSASLISEPCDMRHTYALGSVMHDFSFTTSAGVQTSLGEILQTKKAVLLNFWYVGCTWCIYEFPGLQAAYEKYADDLEIIAISSEDVTAEVEPFRTNANGYYDWDELTFMMVGLDSECAPLLLTTLGVVKSPTSVLIDREGVICMVEEGARDQSVFENLFKEYTSDDYVQNIRFPEKETVEKPDVDAPTSQEIENAINNTATGMVASYYFSDDEYNWPWVVEGDAIKASNSGHNSSYAILYSDMDVLKTEAIAFDYLISSERDYDEFYVFVDGLLVHTFSGVSNVWQTCYAYIPVRNGTYTLSFVYKKDDTQFSGEDTVYIKNMRYVSVDAIDQYTEIAHRCATGNIVGTEYSRYVDVEYSEVDGYFHVGDANGPLVLADLMNPTGWSDLSAWNYVMNGGLSMDVNGDGQDEDLAELFTTYAQIANSSPKYGKLAVNLELWVCLQALVNNYSDYSENGWLELCTYYNVYCGENVKDPAIGRAYYATYDAVLNHDSENPTLNHVIKDTLIMPRGVWFKFVPEETAVYKIYSIGQIDSYVWVKDDTLNFIAENDDDENFVGPMNERGNFAVTLLLEKGRTYYVLCDFNSVDTLGEFDFIIDKLASSGNVWVHASAGEYQAILDRNGNVVGVKLANAVDYELGEDNCYHVKNEDGTLGSLLYVDLTEATILFSSISIEQMLGMSCYYCKSCGFKYTNTVSAFESTDMPICPVCGAKGANSFEKRKMFELPTPLRDNSGNIYFIEYSYEDGTSFVVPLYELNTDRQLDVNNYLNDILTYGIKFTDYTSTLSTYVENSKTLGYYPALPEIGATGTHVGFIPASKELVDILNLFIVFGDYGYSIHMTNVWLMMACYYMYLG